MDPTTSDYVHLGTVCGWLLGVITGMLIIMFISYKLVIFIGSLLCVVGIVMLIENDYEKKFPSEPVDWGDLDDKDDDEKE